MPRFTFLTIILAVFVIFVLHPFSTQAAISPCEKYSSSLTPPSGFAMPYNVYSPTNIIVKAQCDNSANTVALTFGDGTSDSYILNKAYFWRGGAWQETSITPNGATDGNWIVGSGHANITLNSSEVGVNNHILAFICNKDSSGNWQCGCRDSACADHYWQVQRFRLDPPSPCSDGTPANNCTGTAPWYCDGSSSLVENCGSCACTGTWVCGPASTFCCDGVCDNNCSNSGCSLATDPDCGTAGCCGDGTCNATENSSTCPADCPLCIDGATQPCGSSIGECSEGIQTCASNAWGACVGETGPVIEVCDGLDNDCDGVLDNGCACINGATQTCGSSVGECSEGTRTCIAGTWGSCVGEAGPVIETCDGLDNDCDGVLDNGCACINGATQACGSNVGECSEGIQTCVSGAWDSCVGEVSPVTEACDGLDNDCDSVIDNGCACINGATQTCGSDVGECSEGIQTCVTGAWGTCMGEITPQSETCGNGLDEDCDGSDLSCGATINKKLLSKFDDKQIFLVADDNWQEIMSLVSLTTWTSQVSTEYTNCNHVYNGAPNVCAYPSLVYHREAVDTYDADSILHFIDQYSANSITAVNNPPTELSGHINGKGITPDIISINDYLSYWQDYNDVVYVQNNYQLALIASTFASLKNAPLVVSGSSLDVAGTFNGKNVYTIGTVACPASASGCTNFANASALEQEYLNQTSTDKLVLVNYNDLSLFISPGFSPVYSSSYISKSYQNQSISSPFLAGAKHELIISTNAANYSSVDAFINGKISSLGISPNYLTIVAFPEAIQMSEAGLLPGNSSYAETDNNIYADINNDFFPDMSVGRIFALSSADVSSNIARSLFYTDIPESNNFSMLWPDYFYQLKIEGKANDTLLSAAGFNEESIYFDEGYSSLDYSRDVDDKFIINYLDHGHTAGWEGLSSSEFNNQNVWLDSSVVISDACLTCAYEMASFYRKRDLFCAKVLRHGGLMHIGATDSMIAAWSGLFSKEIVGRFIAGEALGDILKEIKRENVVHFKADLMRDGVSSYVNEAWLVLLGDPTFRISSIYPVSINKIEVTENVSSRNITLSIPENSKTMTSYDGSNPSPENHYTYVPLPGKELSRDYQYWDGSNSVIGGTSMCSTGGGSTKTYYVNIDRNYSISDISQVVFIRDDGSEEALTLNSPSATSKADIARSTSRVYITSTLQLGLTISAIGDAYNNSNYIYIKEYSIFYTPCASSLGQTIPAHSYRIIFN